MNRLRRIPVRVRLTLAFVAVMALVLAATGAFVYLRLAVELDRSIDRDLRAETARIAGLVPGEADDDEDLAELAQRRVAADESITQILSADGEVLGAPPGTAARPLVEGERLEAARRGTLEVERTGVQFPGDDDDDDARLRAVPVGSAERDLVVAVAVSLERRDDALENLLALLLIGGPVALGLAAAAGYGVAAGALRPVESMRREAETVSVARPGARLPVPPAEDELGRLGRTLNEMLARQEAAFARERAFVSDAGHELRTPLAILRTELELALREGRSPAELEQALRSAAEETDRLSQLAEDLLVIARSDEGGLAIRAEQVQARDLLESAARRFAARAHTAGRRIEPQAPDGLALVADEQRMAQALGNMLDNALRHGEGTITVAAAERDGEVELAVADEGPGFPDDFLPEAFERFSRADPARTRGGAGLGLAIVRAIARAHGGEARAVNRPAGGAEVVMSLPREAAG